MLADLFYWFCIYVFLPFAFAGLLLAMLVYVANRVRACCKRDLAFVLLSPAALALAFYVTAPVMGEIGIVKGTAVFLVFRLIRLFF